MEDKSSRYVSLPFVRESVVYLVLTPFGQYDHLQHTGPLPRSFLPPLLLAGLSKPLVTALDIVSPDRNPITDQLLSKHPLSTTIQLNDSYLYSPTHPRSSQRIRTHTRRQIPSKSNRKDGSVDMGWVCGDWVPCVLVGGTDGAEYGGDGWR